MTTSTERTASGRRRRTGLFIMLIVAFSALSYASVLFIGGNALRDAPFADPILKLRRGLDNLSNAQPPRDIGELPPLAGTVDQSSIAPSPITVRTSPSPTPSQSPRFIPPEPDSPSIVTFNIEFENTTGVRLTGVRITDDIPRGTSFRSASPPASLQGDSLVWNIGTLEPGESGKVSFQVSTRQKGRISNRAVMTSNEAPPGTIESSANVS